MSREKMVNDCETCYLLWYYGSHQGWFNNSDPLAQSAYRWKKVEPLRQFMMNSVMNKIYTHFYEQSMTEQDFNQAVRRDLNNAFKESVNHKQQWYNSPKKVPMLKELVYKKQLNSLLVEKTKKQVELFIQHFYTGKTFKEMTSTKVKLINFKSSNDLNVGSFHLEELDNVKVFVGIQLLYQRASDNKYVAVLFKSDEEPSSISQLGTIGMYLNKNFGVPLDDVIIRDEHLHDGSVKEHHVNDELMEKMMISIEDSLNMMREFTIDGNLTTNIPLSFEEVSRNHQHKDKNMDDDHCAYCECVRRDLELYPQGYANQA